MRWVPPSLLARHHPAVDGDFLAQISWVRQSGKHSRKISWIDGRRCSNATLACSHSYDAVCIPNSIWHLREYARLAKQAFGPRCDRNGVFREVVASRVHEHEVSETKVQHASCHCAHVAVEEGLDKNDAHQGELICCVFCSFPRLCFSQ